MNGIPRLPLHLLASGAIVTLLGCSRSSSTALAPLPPPIAVETTTAEPRPMPRFLAATGSLIANRRSELAANSAGLVVRAAIERGTFVREGAPLIQLDIRAATLSHAEARANLRNAETQVELTTASCARNQLLFEQGAISKEEAEHSKSQCETSIGTAEAARARAELAAKTMSDATVRAPFSGVIGERFVNVGEYVQPSTKVATLVELDPLRLQFTLGEADIGFVHPHQEVSFEVESFPGERFTGVVKYIDPSVRRETRDLVVEASVANPDHRLRVGMFATCRVPLPDERLVSVPASAVRRGAMGGRLFAIVNGAIEERIVQLGTEKDGYLAVLDGLRPGERLVTSPDQNVKDGVPVR